MWITLETVDRSLHSIKQRQFFIPVMLTSLFSHGVFNKQLHFSPQGNGSVFMTVVNTKQLNADNAPFYQCYQTTDEVTKRTCGRYVNTKDVSSYNIQYETVTLSNHHVPAVVDAKIMRPSTSYNYGFGIFYCRGTQPNNSPTTIPTIFLRRDGKPKYCCHWFHCYCRVHM